MSRFHKRRAPFNTIVNAVFAVFISALVLFFALYFVLSGYLGEGQSVQTLLLEVLPSVAALLLAWFFIRFFLNKRLSSPLKELQSSLKSLSDQVSKGARIEPEETEREFQAARDELSAQSEKLVSLLKYTQKKTDEAAARQERFALSRRIVKEALQDGQNFAGEGYFLSSKISSGKGSAFAFLDAFRIDGETLFFAIGDIWGSGVEAALFLDQLKNGLETGVLAGNLLSRVIESVNSKLYANNPQSIGATLFAGVYNSFTRKLHFVNMGSFAPIAIGSSSAYLHVRTGSPIGLYEKVSPIEEQVEFAEGQGLVFCTEGALLAAGAGKSLAFRKTSMLAHAFAKGPKAAEEILKAVGASSEREEDAAVLVLRCLTKECQNAEGEAGALEREHGLYQTLLSKARSGN